MIEQVNKVICQKASSLLHMTVQLYSPGGANMHPMHCIGSVCMFLSEFEYIEHKHVWESAVCHLGL